MHAKTQETVPSHWGAVAGTYGVARGRPVALNDVTRAGLCVMLVPIVTLLSPLKWKALYPMLVIGRLL